MLIIDKNKLIKQKILDSVKYAIDHGYTIISDDFGNFRDQCLCPLGCVALKNNADPCDSKKISDILLVDEDWIFSFAAGFDGNGKANNAGNSEAWKIGEELSVEIDPISYTKYISTQE